MIYILFDKNKFTRFDDEGARFAPPVPHPEAPPPPARLVMDLTANAGTLATKFRYSSEHNFQYIWACKYFGRGAGVPVQLLQPCNRLPSPDECTLSKVRYQTTKIIHILIII